MTCKEKLIKDHPEWDKRDIMMTLLDRCPMEFMVIGRPDYCGHYVTQDACKTCWDRELYNDDEVETEEDKIMEAVVEDLKTPVIKDSGNRTEFSTGAVRDMREGKGRMDLLPWAAIMEVSKHCENGAKKYGEHNVDRGIPTHSLCDSAARHLAKYLDGWTDEPHLLAATWNLLWAVQMEIKNKNMVDTPWKKNENTLNTPLE